MALQSASLNLIDYNNPKLNINVRGVGLNVTGNPTIEGILHSLKFIITEKSNSSNSSGSSVAVGSGGTGGTGRTGTAGQLSGGQSSVVQLLNPISNALGTYNVNSKIKTYSIQQLTPMDPKSVTDIIANSETPTITYVDGSNSIYNGTPGTGFMLSGFNNIHNDTDTSSPGSTLGAQNYNIEINLAGLYNFTNLNYYGCEVIIYRNIIPSGSSIPVLVSAATWNIDVGNFGYTSFDSSTLASDSAATDLYLTLSTSDIDPTANPPFNDPNTQQPLSYSDWGLENITSRNTILLAMSFGANVLSNSETYSLEFGNFSTGSRTVLSTMPTGSLMLLYGAVPNTTSDPLIPFDTINLNNTTFGSATNPNNTFSFTGVNTTQPLIIAFSIPTSGLTANGLVPAGSYDAVLKTSSSTTIAMAPQTSMSCLYEDSEVLTPSGYVSVKQLQNGDLVTTSDGRISRIVNIMRSKMYASEHTSPVIIPANSIAENYPPKDCRISKYHMIQYNGNWIAPLKNKHIFKADKSIRSVKYYHIQLENYYTDHLVINGGLIVESLGNGERDNTAEWDARVNNSIIL